MDLEFISWILKDGRTKERLDKFKEIINRKDKKIYIIKNQKQLDEFINKVKYI